MSKPHKNQALRLASKRYRHERKRRLKSRQDKLRSIREQEKKSQKKHQQLDYLRELGAELES